MKKLKEKEKKDETKETQEEELRQTILHTSMLIHTNMRRVTHKRDFTQRFFTAQTRLHTIVFTHKKNCYTQTRLHTYVLHTNCFTHKHFYTKTFLHTDSFAHKLFYTLLVFTHKNVYTQTLVCRNTSRHNLFYTLMFLQTRLHANASTHRPFDTQTLLHTTRLHPIYHGKYEMFQTTNQNPIDHWLVVHLPPWKW